MIKISASKLAVTTTVKTIDKKEYEMVGMTIEQLFDEVRFLWKEGFHIIRVSKGDDYFIFDSTSNGGGNIFGKLKKRPT